MATLNLSFRKEQKIIYVQTEDLTIASANGANDGVSILLKVQGNSVNSLTFDSDFEALDGSTFDNTTMNHIFMVFDTEGNGTVPKVFYTIKNTSL